MNAAYDQMNATYNQIIQDIQNSPPPPAGYGCPPPMIMMDPGPTYAHTTCYWIGEDLNCDTY
jgi:hypothetical protein